MDSRLLNKDFLLNDWIRKNKPCVYKFGLGYRGAVAHSITKEEAEKLLPKYSSGMGFYEIKFINNNGVETLEFNELGENDLY